MANKQIRNPQDQTPTHPRRQAVVGEFEIPYKPNMNITSALMEVAANPVTRDGKQTTPVTYDSTVSRRSAAPAR